MTKKEHARFEARAQILKAIAHPTRLYIVDVLSNGERCVRDLREARLEGEEVLHGAVAGRHLPHAVLALLHHERAAAEEDQDLHVHLTPVGSL